MNPNSNIIEISSDYPSDSESSQPSYFPPTIIRGLTKEHARKRRHDPNPANNPLSLSFFPPQCNPNAPPSDEGPSQPPSVFKLVTAFLQSEMERVLVGMSRIPVPEKPQSSQKRPGPLKVVPGLACPKVWTKICRPEGSTSVCRTPRTKAREIWRTSGLVRLFSYGLLLFGFENFLVICPSWIKSLFSVLFIHTTDIFYDHQQNLICTLSISRIRFLQNKH